MRYTISRLKFDAREMVYRVYVTDSLKGLIGAEVRYYDLIYEGKEETADPEEIKTHISDMLAQLGARNGFVQSGGETDA